MVVLSAVEDLCKVHIHIYKYYFTHRAYKMRIYAPLMALLSARLMLIYSFLPTPGRRALCRRTFQDMIRLMSASPRDFIDVTYGNESEHVDENDVKKLAYFLAEVANNLDKQPEAALLLASQEMGWLMSRKSKGGLPGVADSMMSTYPDLKTDAGKDFPKFLCLV